MLEFSKYNKIAGIYRFRNKINNKSYVGQSINIGKRIREHINALRHKTRQYSIHKAILKYGIENFEVEVLTTFDAVENIHKILNLAEQVYISFYDSFKSGYNETAGGDSMHCRKWTSEQKARMKKIMTGRKRCYNIIDPRSKHVFLYKIQTTEYFDVPCVKFVKQIDINIKEKQVQACCVGRHFSTNGYVCAYSREELEYKIQNIKLRKNAN